MSKDIFEVRWHGRGGQGAKTAALLFGDSALDSGMYIQAFPEYGPERMGAPVASFNRLSKKPINVHCSISNPDLVVVLDPSLIGKVNVIEGLQEEGKIIVNSSLSPKEVSEKLGVKNIKVYVVNIHTIKPLDTSLVIDLAKKTNCVITAEDHNIIGGLGSAVAEVLGENYPCLMKRIGMKDKFGESGKPAELYKKYGLDAESVAEEVKKFVKK